MKRLFLSVLLLVATPLCAGAEKSDFPKQLKASVILREDTGLAFGKDHAEYAKAIKEYPHVLNVFLHLENVSSIDVDWVADSSGEAISAELTDANGRPVPEVGHMTSIMYNPTPYLLPYGSQMDWYVSGFNYPVQPKGAKPVGKDVYVLSINGRLWLIPIKTASTYTLRLKLYGFPWTNRLPEEPPRKKRQLLLELPPTKIIIAR